MATVKEILVYFTVPFFLFLLIWRSEGKNQTGLWLITVRETHWISVLPDGTVHSSTTTPTLYNLFRVTTYQEKIDSPMVSTFESMATNSFICINSKGELISKKREQVPGGRKRKRKRSPLHHSCFFSLYNFERNENDWNTMIGIYVGVPRSNGTAGRFIAFDKNGRPQKYKRRLSRLKKRRKIVISLRKPKSISELIQRTRFTRWNGQGGNGRFNLAVRKCLQRVHDELHACRFLRKNVKLISQCQNEVEEQRLSSKKRRSRGNKGDRRTMSQDSKQRNPKTLTSLQLVKDSS